jgi:hypothetical protein
MLIQEVLTDLSRAEVVARAKEFFTTRLNQYTALVSEEGEGHVKFDVEAGEVVIGTATRGGRTLVRGSTSRAHHELSQFFTTLAPAEAVRQNLAGPGASGAG